jgi:hypothetical protein
MGGIGASSIYIGSARIAKDFAFGPNGLKFFLACKSLLKLERNRIIEKGVPPLPEKQPTLDNIGEIISPGSKPISCS